MPLNPALRTSLCAHHGDPATIEREQGVILDPAQRAWYVATREGQFAGSAEIMWREYPSTPEECWRRSIEGTFYAPQLARARVEGRIGIVPHVSRIPVNTFWDIGAGDGTAIWLHQYVGMQHRIIGFLEGWSEGCAHYVRLLRETGFIFGGMFLPHDAVQKRQLAATVAAPLEMLSELAPDWTWHVVPRVQTLQHGIDLTRALFPQLHFDAERCEAGLEHLALYKKKWNATQRAWSDGRRMMARVTQVYSIDEVARRIRPPR